MRDALPERIDIFPRRIALGIPSSNRRSFLKAALVGAAPLLFRLARPEEVSAATLPPGELSLYNTHTDERLEVSYRDRRGRYDGAALVSLDNILRCHYTGQVARMDLKVIEILNLVDKTLGGGHEIEIISGFRSVTYNEWLIRHGHGVAKRSLHLVGKAIDVRLAGVDLDAVRRTALRLGQGGVGYYPRSGFVHLDSGALRAW
jgi:uncharacterized protein YcbK (DUF882 family)